MFVSLLGNTQETENDGKKKKDKHEEQARNTLRLKKREGEKK